MRNYTERRFWKENLDSDCRENRIQQRSAGFRLLRKQTLWGKDSTGLLCLNSFANAAEPEYGIQITKARQAALEQYRFENIVDTLR
jgi:hypothetical protein